MNAGTAYRIPSEMSDASQPRTPSNAPEEGELRTKLDGPLDRAGVVVVDPGIHQLLIEPLVEVRQAAGRKRATEIVQCPLTAQSFADKVTTQVVTFEAR
jgi:hypothetical protein